MRVRVLVHARRATGDGSGAESRRGVWRRSKRERRERPPPTTLVRLRRVLVERVPPARVRDAAPRELRRLRCVDDTRNQHIIIIRTEFVFTRISQTQTWNPRPRQALNHRSSTEYRVHVAHTTLFAVGSHGSSRIIIRVDSTASAFCMEPLLCITTHFNPAKKQ